MYNGEGSERYSRQILFRPIGQVGQEKIEKSRIAIVGMGALGTQIAVQLVRAGISFVRIIDRDIIEPTNLGRQVLYDEDDAQAGFPKAIAAAEKLSGMNQFVTVEPIVTDLTWKNAEKHLGDVDVIMDGSDNFQVRYLINDVAVKHGIPWVYGGAVSSYGTTTFVQPGITPCLVCMFGDNLGGGHDTCDTVGVIMPVVAMIASIQVTETLKYLTGNVDALSRSITHVDVWRNEFQTVNQPKRNGSCRCCGARDFTALLPKTDALTVSLCGRHTIQVRPESVRQISLGTTAARLKPLGQVLQNEHLLRAKVGTFEITLFKDGRALIHGTDDEIVAKKLYAKYIGM